ncbi:hypothetical protein [Celeribacter marinus]|uniref:hypothetical protein n=1 Tax=Celeribacter marinus TaxID=1397108 RepID=UPI003F6AA681
MFDTHNNSNAEVDRNLWESPMVVIATLATIGAVIVSIASIIVVLLGGASASNEWGAFVYIILFVLMLLFTRSYVTPKSRTNCARIGQDQCHKSGRSVRN